jgi:hypothetical protein
MSSVGEYANVAIGVGGYKQKRPVHMHRAESSVRSLPGNTSLTAIEWSDFGEESFEVVPCLLFPSDTSTLVKGEGDFLSQATG